MNQIPLIWPNQNIAPSPRFLWIFRGPISRNQNATKIGGPRSLVEIGRENNFDSKTPTVEPPEPQQKSTESHGLIDFLRHGLPRLPPPLK